MERASNFSLDRRLIYVFLYIIFVVGAIIFRLPQTVSIAQALTPYMLFATGAISIWQMLKWRPDASIRLTLSWVGLVFAVTFAAEVLGVNYGLVFGSYSYGESFGPKLLSVPLIIGLDWVVVIWGIISLVNRSIKSPLLFVATVALLVTAFDWIMEPAAINLGFWDWKDNVIPLSNYLGWLALATFSALLWKMLSSKRELATHPIMTHLFAAQLLFFVINRI